MTVPADDVVVIVTDWNNLDAHGVVRHTGIGLPKVWARDGDEEAPVTGFLVDFGKTRAAQYAAERPAAAPDLIDRSAAIAAVDREGARLPDVGYKTGITSAMRVLESLPAERPADDSLRGEKK